MPTTVVLGAGIIGLSTAYALANLARDDPDNGIHVIEPSPELFASASGKAAGFIAKDWFAPPIAPLGALSFELHRKLAEQHNGRERWGWSESVSYSLDRDIRVVEPPPFDIPVPHEHGITGRNGGGNEGGVDWVLNGSSRATVANTEQEAQTQAAADRVDLSHPAWLRSGPGALQPISDSRSTGQVHPLQLCEFLLEQCIALGVTLHHPARATGLTPGADGTSATLHIASTRGDAHTLDLPVDSIVLAAGAWTPRVFRELFPHARRTPLVTPLAGHSVVLRSRHWPPPGLPATAATSTATPGAPGTATVHGLARPALVAAPPGLDMGAAVRAPGVGPCHAVFTSDPAGFSPEIFSRVGGDVWLGGLNSPSIPLPALPNEAAIDPGSIGRLMDVARQLCQDDVEVLREGLCFRPVSSSGRPIVVQVAPGELGLGESAPGVFIATGHGPWGISLSLGTGQVVAEMVLGRPTSADVRALGRWC